MSFRAAHWLALLAVVALLAGAYVWVQVRGRRQAAVRFTNLDLLASVAPDRPGWRRHVGAVLLLVALAAIVVSLARPVRQVRVARDRAVVIMAVDVSLSMEATDVEPSRLDAAQDAAAAFARSLPDSVQLGLVEFAGSANVVVPATTDHDTVVRAIERLELREATAIGEAVLASLSAIRTALDDEGEDGVPPPSSIVLLSDGHTTVGTPNEEAAERAAEAGVPVTTIAFGTEDGVVEQEGETVPVAVDRPALAALAEATGGKAFTAITGEELEDAYEDVTTTVGSMRERREMTTVAAAAAFVLGSLAAAAALRWTARLP